jgi:hypothetical protein
MFKKKKKIIGRLELINIPTLNLEKVAAKIDTGAYRGSIHASNIEVINQEGKEVLKFKVLDENHPEYKDKTYSFDNFKIHKFRGTKVDYHERYVVPIQIEIVGEKINVELSLTDRKDLRHPILLGRRALKKRFLIDVDQKNI